MKLLRDEFLFAIKVDYYMWSEEKGDYTEPVYLSIDTETKRKDGTLAGIIIFETEIKENLRVFDREGDAIYYLEKRGKETCCYTNGRVIKIKYNFESNTWEEI
jgi:hypothetical protein